MKYAYDFRAIARDALRGNWGIAILTGFVASLIGATLYTSSGGGSSNSYNSTDGNTPDFLSSEILENILPFLLILIAVLAIWGLVIFIIGGAGKLGYARFNLNLIDKKPAAFSDLFSQFNRLGDGFCMDLLMRIYIFLWSLLFIIPGIIKSYSYSMTPYILLEHPEMSPNRAITESKIMMSGNKWRLFCLEFSFIGWELLGLAPALLTIPLMLTGSIGVVLWLIIIFMFALVLSLFLRPYQEAARAAFYREVSCTNLPPFIPTTETFEGTTEE